MCIFHLLTLMVVDFQSPAYFGVDANISTKMALRWTRDTSSSRRPCSECHGHGPSVVRHRLRPYSTTPTSTRPTRLNPYVRHARGWYFPTHSHCGVIVDSLHTYQLIMSML